MTLLVSPSLLSTWTFGLSCASSRPRHGGSPDVGDLAFGKLSGAAAQRTIYCMTSTCPSPKLDPAKRLDLRPVWGRHSRRCVTCSSKASCPRPVPGRRCSWRTPHCVISWWLPCGAVGARGSTTRIAPSGCFCDGAGAVGARRSRSCVPRRSSPGIAVALDEVSSQDGGTRCSSSSTTLT